MSLYTGCIYRTNHSGTRISVMSRHTLNDGITPYDEWQQHLAPPGKVVGAYLRGELSWNSAVFWYVQHLRKAGIEEQVKALAVHALGTDITILCREETPERCHRRLLAMRCKMLVPELDVVLQ
jgi:uncharacterized protein YeaO (DUF488 family)